MMLTKISLKILKGVKECLYILIKPVCEMMKIMRQNNIN